MGPLSQDLALEFLLNHLHCLESLEHLLFTNEPQLSSDPGWDTAGTVSPLGL